MVAVLGLGGCGSGDSDSDAPEVKVPLPTPPAPVVTTPPPATTPEDKPCTYTTTPGAAATDTSTYVPAASEALNPNLITAATVKPSAGGALQTKKIDCLVTLTDKNGKPIQLRGMSTAGLQWFPNILNGNAFETLNKDWGSNVVRLAMYVGEEGYATKPELFDKVTQGIDLAIANDLYVIVDWHVLTPGDPNADVYKGALEFFRKISQKYPNHQNIIYELANEPNNQLPGPGVSNDAAGWAKVKSYATPIIKMLRDAGNKNLVIVGTPNWSQRPDLAADDPIDDANVMYTVHFYSGTHLPSNVSTDRSNVMSNARYALEHGVGVFATEWGVSQASGSEGVYLKDADRWLDFLNKHNISWVNWNLSNNNETSAAFAISTSLNPGDDHAWAPLELSLSGEYARNRIKGTAFVPVDRPVIDPGTGGAFTTVVNDFNDGTLGGWGIQGQSPVKSVTLSNEGGALKLTGMTASTDVSTGNIWNNVRISGDQITARPNLADAKSMTIDVVVDAATTVAIAAVPQSATQGWANPTAVVAKPSDFVVQPNGKYKATLTFTPTDAPNLQRIIDETTLQGTTLTNVILFVGAQNTNTVTIDNITFTSDKPFTP